MSRGRGRDRECRRSPNVVKDISNFNLTYLGLVATNLDESKTVLGLMIQQLWRELEQKNCFNFNWM